MQDVSVRTMLLEFMDANGASHIREMHIEILRHKPGTPEHTIRARLREMLMVCLRPCYDALEAGGRLAVLMGDVRRAGQYTPIVKDVLNFPCGEIRSVIIKVQHHCASDRKSYGKLEDVPIRHEYCVVFKKPVSESQAQMRSTTRTSTRSNWAQTPGNISHFDGVSLHRQQSLEPVLFPDTLSQRLALRIFPMRQHHQRPAGSNGIDPAQ